MENIKVKLALTAAIALLAAVNACFANNWDVSIGYDSLPVTISAPGLVPNGNLFRNNIKNSSDPVLLQSIGVSYYLKDDLTLGAEYCSPISYSDGQESVKFDYSIVGQTSVYEREYKRVHTPKLDVIRLILKKYMGIQDNMRALVYGGISCNRLEIRSATSENLTYEGAANQEYSSSYDTNITAFTYILGLGIEFDWLGLIFQINENMQTTASSDFDTDQFNYLKLSEQSLPGEVSRTKGEVKIGNGMTQAIRIGYRF